ncbi:MAG: hypothetical protein ACK4PI_07740 [Tepidisphaerales bacterium]
MRLPTLSAVMLCLLAAHAASGQPGRTAALLNEALDQQVNLSVNAVLPEALRLIGDQTGVRIEAPPSLWDVLPWGEQTNITATIQNKTLREALTAITRKLGLTFVLRENAVELQPLPALQRLGRRATLQELQAIDTLMSLPYPVDNLRPTVRQVLQTVDQVLLDAKTEFAVENRAPQGPVQETIIPVPRGASLADALEAVARATSLTWYPWSRSIVVLPKEDQIRVLLQRPVTLHLRGEDVGQVLMDLSRKSGVTFVIEPGAVQRVPPEFRSVRLTVDNAPVQQVLEQLAAVTGLGYVVTDKVGHGGSIGGGGLEGGVYIWNNSPVPLASAATPSRPAQDDTSTGEPRITLLLPLGNGVQMAVPERELPPDVRQYLQFKREQELLRLRDEMRQQGFVPPPAAP